MACAYLAALTGGFAALVYTGSNLFAVYVLFVIAASFAVGLAIGTTWAAALPAAVLLVGGGFAAVEPVPVTMEELAADPRPAELWLLTGLTGASLGWAAALVAVLAGQHTALTRGHPGPPPADERIAEKRARG